jgi:hypothetical protein
MLHAYAYAYAQVYVKRMKLRARLSTQLIPPMMQTPRIFSASFGGYGIRS